MYRPLIRTPPRHPVNAIVEVHPPALYLLRERVAIEKHAQIHGCPVGKGHIVLDEQGVRASLTELRGLSREVAGAERRYTVLRDVRNKAPPVGEPVERLFAELRAAARLQAWLLPPIRELAEVARFVAAKFLIFVNWLPPT